MAQVQKQPTLTIEQFRRLYAAVRFRLNRADDFLEPNVTQSMVMTDEPVEADDDELYFFTVGKRVHDGSVYAEGGKTVQLAELSIQRLKDGGAGGAPPIIHARYDYDTRKLTVVIQDPSEDVESLIADLTPESENAQATRNYFERMQRPKTPLEINEGNEARGLSLARGILYCGDRPELDQADHPYVIAGMVRLLNEPQPFGYEELANNAVAWANDESTPVEWKVYAFLVLVQTKATEDVRKAPGYDAATGALRSYVLA